MKITKKEGGFNLIELLVVMAIIAILIALVIAAINIARRAARDTERRSNADAIKVALEDYFARNKEYPKSTGTTGLNNITGLITGTSVNLTDPQGENNRYYYRRGTCSNDRTGQYVLRVLMEGENSAAGAMANCTTGEDFSQQ